MALGLQKSLILLHRRLQNLAAAQLANRLNAREVHEFDIPGSQQFSPDFFPGFFNDPSP